MSELEKLQREQYQTKRNKYIFLQRILLVVLTAVLLLCSVIYIGLDKDTYVYYAEEGNAIHRAYLSENEFYEEGYLNGSHAYVSALVQKMTALFTYDLVFDTDKVTFKYSYHIDAQLEVLDKGSSAPLYNPTYTVVPLTTNTYTGKKLAINELVDIDYQKYNAIAEAYRAEFALKDAISTLIVRMHVEVRGESENFAKDSSGEYVTELRIPLTQATFKPVVSATTPAGEQKILAIDEDVKLAFAVLAIVFGVIDVFAAIFFTCYVISTRDKHIDYKRKVNKILTSYKSYIQRITNEFDMEGYRVLRMSDIAELLEIRNTIQKPILTFENEDKTCSKFFIVDDVNIIYLLEIKVEDDLRPRENKMGWDFIPKPASAGTPSPEVQIEIDLSPEPNPEPVPEPEPEPEPESEEVSAVAPTDQENNCPRRACCPKKQVSVKVRGFNRKWGKFNK